MKKIFTLLFLSSILFTACEGDQGPVGPQGPGGGLFLAETFERTVDFNASNGFSAEIILDPIIENSDVVLVYRLEEVFDGRDVWEPLPTTSIFLNDANDTSVLYRFNFSFAEILLLMESNNPDLVPADLTNNQTFRFVIVPSEFAETTNINLLDFDEVQSALNLEF
ncbi:hypothetical protein [uncultured Aquimarina sp.]|uniref:hypothetical protein n=1 Tax=uncultured Aquimarina sp. TaxID=575652 RepID=UPI00262B5BD8|nr:hypothetical protein [uncultured Aquimarina sp.]